MNQEEQLEKEEEKFWEAYEKQKRKKEKSLLNDKSGQIFTSEFNIFTFMILAFIVVMLFAGWIYAHGILTDTFRQIGTANEVNAGQPGYTNMSYAAETTFGVMDVSIKSLRIVSAVWILGFAACIIITNVFVKTNPMWFFAYLLVTLLAVVLSVPISNAYQSIAVTDVFGGELQNFTISNWILSYLPVLTIVLGILGGIFLFINMVRTSPEGTLP